MESVAFAGIGEDLGSIEMSNAYAITKQFKTEEEFSTHIEQTAIKNGDTLMFTILEYCDQYDIEEEDIAKLVSKSLKEKVLEEAIEAKLMPNINGVLDL